MKDNQFYPEDSARFAAAIEVLRGQKVAVLGHQRPDGDCIGSTVALVRVLRTLGIDAVGLNRDAIPATLKAFVGDTPMFLAEDFTPAGHVAVSVDCADFKRVGERLNELFPTVALNVDHHISNKLYGSENLVIATACATAEILAGFYLDNGYEIDAVTAQALYVGIATDTGQFRFPSTTPDTFEIARRLCECGANPSAAAHELYERESFAKIKLLQHFLNSLSMEFNNRVCVGLIQDGVYEECGATIDDSEGLVDYARSIDGVEIGVLIEDCAGALKGSLRAKDPKQRVDQIAKQFGGGGHACAAGLNVAKSSIKEFYPQLMAAIGAHLSTID
ncbi:DHH family phosphoesterase [Coraliomargarita sp. SDUM461004]|uniref:DHH family phosphoesterase n=1 Tax=Thalassobacterium sedimentorum TaxID=3041258 RepID=A0ABU1AKU1_9BACT|nr:DHH family phosphoesterase [Coraliomargarita sp. SDUM461004]MDQ8194361.1 DHH family phosphoesterase [Coraliomargarita sp. SDUM461004]